jgi:archaemetzincin
VEKETLHELGHILGLEHCPNPRCVMSFSNSIYDVDRKEARFCEMCKKKLVSMGL